MPNFAPADLHALALASLLAVGTSPEGAAMVADSLIEGNLTGHDSHGVIRLPLYIQDAGEGLVQAAAIPPTRCLDISTSSTQAGAAAQLRSSPSSSSGTAALPWPGMFPWPTKRAAMRNRL